MEYAVLGIAICLFIVPMWAYRRGLKDGLAIDTGKPMEPIRSPIQVVKDHQQAVETKKEADKLMQGIENLFAYTGDKQRED